MKRRVFVAVILPPDLQERIMAWQRQMNLPVRWIAGKNLHITLVPPWYEEDLESVRRNLRRLQQHSPFEIAFSSITFGPNPRRTRLIWATGETTKEIKELQEHVESCLGAHNDQQFRLHVTIARFRAEDFPSFPVKRIDERVDWRMTVRSVVLMESHLSRSGADYEILEQIPLGNTQERL